MNDSKTLIVMYPNVRQAVYGLDRFCYSHHEIIDDVNPYTRRVKLTSWEVLWFKGETECPAKLKFIHGTIVFSDKFEK